MQPPTQSELQERYAAMSPEEFASLNVSTLSAVAKLAYEHEVKRRGSPEWIAEQRAAEQESEAKILEKIASLDDPKQRMRRPTSVTFASGLCFVSVLATAAVHFDIAGLTTNTDSTLVSQAQYFVISSALLVACGIGLFLGETWGRNLWLWVVPAMWVGGIVVFDQRAGGAILIWLATVLAFRGYKVRCYFDGLTQAEWYRREPKK